MAAGRAGVRFPRSERPRRRRADADPGERSCAVSFEVRMPEVQGVVILLPRLVLRRFLRRLIAKDRPEGGLRMLWGGAGS